MKTLLILTILLLPALSFAEVSGVLEQYFGCYKTVKMNGKDIVSENPIQTEITQDYSPYLDAETKTMIPAVKLFIYQGKFDDGHHMQLSYIPSDRGTITSDANGNYYNFDGKIRFTTKPENVFTLHIRVDFRKISDQQIELSVFNKFDEVGNGATTSFLLEKAVCSEE